MEHQGLHTLRYMLPDTPWSTLTLAWRIRSKIESLPAVWDDFWEEEGLEYLDWDSMKEDVMAVRGWW